jgi:hypothetical protein
MIRYTRDEIIRIRNNDINTFTHSEQVIKLINDIVSEVGCPQYSKTPSFIKKKRVNSRENNEYMLKKGLSFDSYQKKKETLLESVLVILNKITSSQTYEKLRTQLFNLIENHEVEEISLREIATKIYKIASGNIFNSNLYAILYNDLIEKYPIFKEYCLEEYNDYIDLFENIKIVNPEQDYDTFCKCTFHNDSVRAISNFFTELVRYNILSIDNIVNLINILQMKLILKGKENTPDENPCIEFSENIYILISKCLNELIKHDKWNDILENIKNMKNIDRSNNNNITPKIKFKHMDMLDLINKK